MSRPFTRCAPASAKLIAELGDRFISNKKVKEMFTESGADNIVVDKFYELFHRPIEEWRDLRITRTKLDLFEKELNHVVKAVESGSLLSVVSSAMVTDATVRKHPTLKKFYHDMIRVNAFGKGNAGKADRSHKRMMKAIEQSAISRGMNFNAKKANELEASIHEMGIKITNGEVPIEALEPLVSKQTDFLMSHEGKAMVDFARGTEILLPKLRDKILNTKDKDGNTWMSEQKLKSARVGHKISESLGEKIKQLLRTEKLDGESLDPHMVEAIYQGMDLTSMMYRTAEKGVDAIIKGYEYGMEAKGYNIENPKWIETKKSLKKELLPKEMIGYIPHYGYKQDMKFMDSMMPKLDELMIRTRDSLEKDIFSIDSAIDDIRATISDRLKSREELSPNDLSSYSRNIPVIMKRYIDEINQFNQNAFVTRDTRKVLRDMKKMFRKGKDLSNYGQSALKLVLAMHADQTGLKERMNPELESFQRAVLNLEFISKLGLNIRSGFKQFNQYLAHLVEFGIAGEHNMRQLYKQDPELGTIVDRLSAEAGIYFEELPPELQEIAGAKLGKTRIVETEAGYKLEHHTPGLMSRFAGMTQWGAGKSGIFMRKSENMLRKATFRTAFGSMHQELKYSPEFYRVFSERYAKTHEGRVPSEGQMTNEIYRRSREYAINMVGLIHFNYEKIAKSPIMKQGAGRFLFQFQHFSHSFWNWNAKKMRGAHSAVKTLDFTSVEAKQAFGVALAYGLAPVMAAYATGWDVSRLIENESWEKIRQIGALVSGDEDYIKEKFAGRGALSTVISAPVMTDLLRAMELAEWYRLDEDSALRYIIAYRGYHDKTQDNFFGEAVKIASTQFGRGFNHTFPMFFKSPATWLTHEAGLYKTKKVRDFRRSINEKVGMMSPDLERSLNKIMGVAKKKRKKKKKGIGRRAG